MNFKHVNPKNVGHLVAPWVSPSFEIASLLEEVIENCPYPIVPKSDRTAITCAIRFIETDDRWRAEFVQPQEASKEFSGSLFIRARNSDVIIPLRLLFKGSQDLRGTNSLYCHAFHDEAELCYYGITKQRWFDRFSQHLSSARNGSPYLFHKALRQKSDVRLIHRVLISGLDRVEIMALEEEAVAAYSLYPLGLNMIPGGEAGYRYLASLGIALKDAEWRDRVLVEAMSRPSTAGRPNPLCAARWETDQNFVNRLVCGHSGRFTVEEVRHYRGLLASGISASRLSDLFGHSVARIKNLLRGRTYSRIS